MSPVSEPFSCWLFTRLSSAVAKGVSANMMKISSKRRRTQAQIKADKEEAQRKEVAAQNKQLQIL